MGLYSMQWVLFACCWWLRKGHEAHVSTQGSQPALPTACTTYSRLNVLPPPPQRQVQPTLAANRPALAQLPPLGSQDICTQLLQRGPSQWWCAVAYRHCWYSPAGQCPLLGSQTISTICMKQADLLSPCDSSMHTVSTRCPTSAAHLHSTKHTPPSLCPALRHTLCPCTAPPPTDCPQVRPHPPTKAC